MECKFVVGQKVVCIGGPWLCVEWDSPPPPFLPKRGEVYSIIAISARFGGIYLTFKEIIGDHNFNHTGFRPLQERPKEADTDISVFSPLLNVRETEPV